MFLCQIKVVLALTMEKLLWFNRIKSSVMFFTCEHQQGTRKRKHKLCYGKITVGFDLPDILCRPSHFEGLHQVLACPKTVPVIQGARWKKFVVVLLVVHSPRCGITLVPSPASGYQDQQRSVCLLIPSSVAVSTQVLVQPQIIKTDSLVLTTLKADGNPVMAAVQNPALTALTTPIQTTALQVPP